MTLNKNLILTDSESIEEILSSLILIKADLDKLAKSNSSKPILSNKELSDLLGVSTQTLQKL